jgi:D-3-phosphoglycerate dehydrogenase
VKVHVCARARVFDVVEISLSEPTEREAKFTTPLQGCPNVLLTPHIGGSTEEAQAAIGFEVGLKLDRYIKEGCTLGAVNFPELLVDRAPNTSRILNVHRNVPGVLKALNNILANFNVLSQTLRTQDDIGCVRARVCKLTAHSCNS